MFEHFHAMGRIFNTQHEKIMSSMPLKRSKIDLKRFSKAVQLILV